MQYACISLQRYHKDHIISYFTRSNFNYIRRCFTDRIKRCDFAIFQKHEKILKFIYSNFTLFYSPKKKHHKSQQTHPIANKKSHTTAYNKHTTQFTTKTQHISQHTTNKTPKHKLTHITAYNKHTPQLKTNTHHSLQ